MEGAVSTVSIHKLAKVPALTSNTCEFMAMGSSTQHFLVHVRIIVVCATVDQQCSCS